MKKKAVAIFLGAALAAIVSFVGAGGCEDTQNAFNCSQLCNRYKDCFDSNYNVGACEDRCQSIADVNDAAHNRANACQNCLDDNSCAGAAFNCPDCTGLLP